MMTRLYLFLMSDPRFRRELEACLFICGLLFLIWLITLAVQAASSDLCEDDEPETPH